MKKIKLLELFSGYGGAHFALKKAGYNVKCIGTSEIEDCANYIYALNHKGNIPQLGDITKIDPHKLEDFDLLTGGFPCQSFSMAGKRQGFEAANKGKLFFEIIRIAKVKKPKYMLLENVEGIISHDNGKTMQVVLQELRYIGYDVFWKKLYSKNHGIPQTRPRIWFVCKFGEWGFGEFHWPQKEKLKITVKDILEDNVDEKYYLTREQIHARKHATFIQHKYFVNLENQYTRTLLTHSHLTLELNKKIYRVFTPRECFRLQGFLNDEIKFFDISNSQLYFLAGNGWEIQTASKILKNMLKGI